MQQLIISTLLKYNEIFDALQQVFQLHNYNCNEQKASLGKYLEANSKASCIYVTFNTNMDFLGINEKFLKLEKTMTSNIENMFQYHQRTTEKVFTDKIEELEKTITKQINVINEDSEIFKANVSETYFTVAQAKQQNKNLNLSLDKLNHEIEYIQHKYALRQTLDENLVEVRDCISNISQSISYLRNDVQLQFKKIADMKQQMQKDQVHVSEQLQVLQKETEQISECFNQIGQANLRFENQRKEFEVLQNKFKSIATLFQQMEVNNSKTVKFEIHSTIRKFDEDMLKLSVTSQILNDQIQKLLEKSLEHESKQSDLKDDMEKMTEQINAENKLVTKQFCKLSRLVEQLKEHVTQSNSISQDIPSQLNTINSQIQYQWKYFNQCLSMTRESLDVIQDFCETLQIPSQNKDKDLTNLILLLDRRLCELKRSLYSSHQKSRTNYQQTLLKLQTPRNSQQFGTPVRIHSQQPRRCIYSKNGSQTISLDSKRETIVIQ